MTEKTEQIARLRERIDAVDDQLVALLVERASLAHDVGVAKGTAAVYRPERERAIIERVIEKSRALGARLAGASLARKADARGLSRSAGNLLRDGGYLCFRARRPNAGRSEH